MNFLAEKGIYWWKTPAQSSGLGGAEERNEEENRAEEFVDGILKVWDQRMTPHVKCTRCTYIDHLYKVILSVIEGMAKRPPTVVK